MKKTALNINNIGLTYLLLVGAQISQKLEDEIYMKVNFDVLSEEEQRPPGQGRLHH